MIRRIIAGVVLSALVLTGSCIDKANNTEDARAQRCADRLGVSWSPEDGTTERLAAFGRCLSNG